MSIEERIKITREAIMLIRQDKRNWPNPKDKWAITYGSYGLLDYIEFGKPEKILVPTIRNAVEKIIALQSLSMGETE